MLRDLIVNVVFIVGWRLSLLAAFPAFVFWAVRTLVPTWAVPFTPSTVAAFWIVYVAVRVGIQTIRHSQWESPIQLNRDGRIDGGV